MQNGRPGYDDAKKENDPISTVLCALSKKSHGRATSAHANQNHPELRDVRRQPHRRVDGGSSDADSAAEVRRAYTGALFIHYEQAREILNFGAFLAFMGVNLATFWQFSMGKQPGYKRRWFADVVMPLVGFVFCLWIWLGLKLPAKIVGGIWLAAGLIYSAVKTRGFRERSMMIDFKES